jgi:DNA-binding GntR family transcriptional regulator
MRLSYESQVRASTVQRYYDGKPQALDQLEEWMKENPIPYISNDKFSQEDIFDYWAVRLPGHTHVNQTYVWLTCR